MNCAIIGSHAILPLAVVISVKSVTLSGTQTLLPMSPVRLGKFILTGSGVGICSIIIVLGETVNGRTILFVLAGSDCALVTLIGVGVSDICTDVVLPGAPKTSKHTSNKVEPFGKVSGFSPELSIQK